MQIVYIFFYTLAFPSYLNNMWVPIEKKHAPGDYEYNLKVFWLNVLSAKCPNA